MLGDESDALDSTQEALLLAVRSMSRFDGRSSFATWIYRIATNACIDELRRRRRRPLVTLGGDLGADVHGNGSEASAPRSSATTSLVDPSEEASARVDVDLALSSLPLEFRTAVVLRDMCDLTYEEIAHVLDVPVGTVRSRIARGRAALADVLGGGRNQAGSPNVEEAMGT